MVHPDATRKKYHILFYRSVNFPENKWHKYTMFFITLRGQFEIVQKLFL